MNNCPLYQKIVEGLGRITDRDLFERCVVDLLKTDWPTLVPVPGGRDAGMDGAWSDQLGSGFLVTTSGVDVKRNLRRSLDSHRKNGDGRKHVILATSRAVNAQERGKLTDLAAERGFHLLPVHDQTSIVNLLYRNPRWCKELLGVGGHPVALSVLPRDRRGMRDLPLIGRDDDLDWLCSVSGDRMLVGQPGMGKSFLLAAFAQEQAALFAVNEDLDRIADDFREKQPRAIIVEDAHVRQGLLASLRRYREESGADFCIIADSWPGDCKDVQDALAVPKARVRVLERLTDEQILALVNAAGIAGPNGLLCQIVQQSRGCPGRAAVLAELCVKEGIKDVWLGDALGRLVERKLSSLAGERSVQLLAAFALGGRAGMTIRGIADLFRYSVGDVYLDLTKLAAGGVIERQGEAVVSVHPDALRCVLVRDYFFGKGVPLPASEFLAVVRDDDSATLTLIGAYARGGDVPQDLLRDRVERSGNIEVWRAFAGSDPAHADLILERHSAWVPAVADALLDCSPERTVCALLERAVGDDRAQHSNPDHPLRELHDWVVGGRPGTTDALARRRILLSTSLAWMRNGGDQETATASLADALCPFFDEHEPNPGNSRAITILRGTLLPDELRELADLWSEAFRSLKSVNEITKWSSLLDLAANWTYPQRGGSKPTEQHIDAFRQGAKKILPDLAALASNHPGVLQSLKGYAQELELPLNLTIDADYVALFPCERLSEDWRTEQHDQLQAIDARVEHWRGRRPSDIAARIVWCSNEAEFANHTYPDLTQIMCARLAAGANAHEELFDALVEAGAKLHLVAAMLEELCKIDSPGWLDRAVTCMAHEHYYGAGLSVLLSAQSVPANVWTKVIERVPVLPNLVTHYCRSPEADVQRIGTLLDHENDKVALCAVQGFTEQDDATDMLEGLEDKVLNVLIRCEVREHRLKEVLVRHPNVAVAWLLDRATREHRPLRFEHQAIASAVRALDGPQKRKVLFSLNDVICADDIARALVGDDVDLYCALVESSDLRHVHLAPLRRQCGEVWAALASAALRAGYSVEAVAGTACSVGGMWRGELSEMYLADAERWKALEEHSDPGIRDCAVIGKRWAMQRHEQEREQEKFRDAID